MCLCYSGLPNIWSNGSGYNDQFDLQQFGFYGLNGAMYASRQGPRKFDREQYASDSPGVLGWTFDASRNSALYGASETNQPKSVRSLCLIRAYEI